MVRWDCSRAWGKKKEAAWQQPPSQIDQIEKRAYPLFVKLRVMCLVICLVRLRTTEACFSPFRLASLAGVLATLAFLVVFKVLIKLFFWMDMLFALLAEFFCCLNLVPRGRLTVLQVICQTSGMPGWRDVPLKRKRLVPKYQWECEPLR